MRWDTWSNAIKCFCFELVMNQDLVLPIATTRLTVKLDMAFLSYRPERHSSQSGTLHLD